MKDLFLSCKTGTLFRPLSQLKFVHLDLRYAGPDNVCGRDLYLGEKEAWLHRDAFEALQACGHFMQEMLPDWRLRIFDAARPLSVQAQLYAQVVGTPEQAYVADPAVGSPHNYGFALDVGLSNPQGQEADLGSPFDSFHRLSQPQLEEAFAGSGELSPCALDLRRQLRRIMAGGGWRMHPLEWWHFDLKSVPELADYPRL